MAMLLLPDVFQRTWGRTMEPFWPGALEAVRADHPGVLFMAEVYWDREFDLQQQGFDETYDKRLYDRLNSDLREVRGHLTADPGYQARSARFLENHDEPRAATVFGTGDRHRAAATIAFLCPGLRFFHDGQRQGYRLHVPVHLCRAPDEPQDDELVAFYDALFGILGEPAVHDGDWRLLDVAEAWSGNPSHDAIVASSWTAEPGGSLRFVVTVNLADHWSQGYVALPHPDLAGRDVTLHDRLGSDSYVRHGVDLLAHGLYLDVPPWSHQVFGIS
jgi:glycosidase